MYVKKLVFLILVLAVLLATTIMPLYKVAASPTGCVFIDIASGDGFTKQNWDPAPAGSACLVTTFPDAGEMSVTGGWVFTAPLMINGTEITTELVAGQLAPQIVPFKKTVTAGETWIWEPSWLESGPELGFWYIFTPGAITPTPTPPPPVTGDKTVYLPLILKPVEPLLITQKINKTGGIVTVKGSWPQAPADQQVCLVVDFADGGNLATLESGWFFGQKIEGYLNGNAIDIPSFTQTGEIATQIGQAKLPEPVELKVCTSNTTTGTEIGLRINYQ